MSSQDSSKGGSSRPSSVLPFQNMMNMNGPRSGSLSGNRPEFNVHNRRMSIGTVNLSSYQGFSPASPSSIPTGWSHRGSIASSISDDCPIAENGRSLPMASQLGRRLSTSGVPPIRTARGSVPSSPTANEGFNAAENFRNRAQRASMSAASGAPRPNFGPFSSGHSRAFSISDSSASPPAPAISTPVGQSRMQAPQGKRGLSDPIQERILKGDFYMD